MKSLDISRSSRCAGTIEVVAVDRFVLSRLLGRKLVQTLNES